MFWLDSDAIVNRRGDSPGAARITFRRLHEDMAEEKLNLLPFPAGCPAEAGTTTWIQGSPMSLSMLEVIDGQWTTSCGPNLVDDGIPSGWQSVRRSSPAEPELHSPSGVIRLKHPARSGRSARCRLLTHVVLVGALPRANPSAPAAALAISQWSVNRQQHGSNDLTANSNGSDVPRSAKKGALG